MSLKPAPSPWERVHPRSRRRGGWHRLRRCSRLKPLLQVQREPEACAVPVGAGSPAKQVTRWMAPAAPVFAAEAAPTGTARAQSLRRPCGSGFTREAGDAVDGTGCAGVHGHGRSRRYRVSLKPAPSLWERVHPRSRRRGGWHRLRRCSRLKPLLQVPREPEACAVPVGAGSPAKQATRWMAPATPVFAAEAAPTGVASTRSQRSTCGGGHAPMTSGLSASAWAPPPLGIRPGSRSRNPHRPA
ncbi:hypothetical protein E5221_11835 [Pseudomonas sp. A2]|nr:hypothetical protein E5221_11835 [Pseudomonas sp. A2]